jgi:hypothetical protein
MICPKCAYALDAFDHECPRCHGRGLSPQAVLSRPALALPFLSVKQDKRGIVLKFGFVGTIVVSGAVGVVVLSLLSHVYWLITDSTVPNDGQYIVSFLFTYPLGWLTGTIVGSILVALRKDLPKPRKTGWIYIGLIIGGFFATPFFFLFTANALRMLLLPLDLLFAHFR